MTDSNRTLSSPDPRTPLAVLSPAAAPVRPAYEDLPAAAAPHAAVDALYVHVPFCSTKCHYCDFYSLAGHLEHADQFLHALAEEISQWTERLPRIQPETIFIGGGTPTLLDPPRISRLLALITQAIDPSRLREFTIEANPNTFDADRASALVSHGVNRISFGAQSFNPAELRTLQRDHDPENVPRAFDLARAAGIDNLNLDLIFGIPGQTLDSWEFSLARALDLRPRHMSCYSLTYEPNTAMTARMKRGEFAPIDENLELAMFEHVYHRMRAAGFDRYEVSNYALPGFECRHNIHYWKGGNWLAWGPSAAGHLSGWRWKNVGSLAHYLDALLPPAAPAVLPMTQLEHLSPMHWAGEVATFWLRLSAGLDYAEFRARTGVDARPVLERALKKFADMGFVELTPHRALLVEKAVPVSNAILRDVLAAFI
ncbi:MAG: radical SAM family heme chaperone HemW [Phycisphaerae bacterium]